jgi:acyl-CoA thioester hydrolase
MAADSYRSSFVVRWADVDFNGHMKNTAYLDTCVDVRFGYFASAGFGALEFLRARLGPVVRRDVVEYFREMRFRDRFVVDIALAGVSEDASRFSIRNRFFREDDQLAAHVTSTGGWLDLDTRRLVEPPTPLRDALVALARSEDFTTLQSSVG